MDILYIGHYNVGSTTRMRGEYLKELLPVSSFTLADIDIPLTATGRMWRSIGWRYKYGPLISNIDTHIKKCLQGRFSYDIVWIDKGVFIQPALVEKLRARSNILVHYTPDPAFTYHQSKLFFDSMKYYDYCITTKSFEVEQYKKCGVKCLLSSQGFDPLLHRPYHSFEQKNGVVFIGHREDDREYILSQLISRKVSVTLAGISWEKFAKKNRSSSYLNYLGKGIFGEAYAKEISRAKVGLGLLSKIIPELHTTRTFEIPACGTALVTESNAETRSFFQDDEAIFYTDVDAMISSVVEGIDDTVKLTALSHKGQKKVNEAGFDYKSILKKLLLEMNLPGVKTM